MIEKELTSRDIGLLSNNITIISYSTISFRKHF